MSFAIALAGTVCLLGIVQIQYRRIMAHRLDRRQLRHSARAAETRELPEGDS